MDDTPSSTLRGPAGLLLAVIVGGLFYLAGILVENRASRTPSQPGTINVSGEGRVSAAPDIARLSLGVTTKRMNAADDVMAVLKKDMTAVIDALAAQGVEEKDIRTDAFSIHPVYDYVDGNQVPKGFQGNQMLTVKVRDLSKAGEILAAATRAGANDAGGVQFAIDDLEEVRQRARQEAIDQAKERAQALAKQLGVPLGRLTSFSESGGFEQPMPYYALARDEKAMTSNAVPLPAGEQDTTVTVYLTYELQ